MGRTLQYEQNKQNPQPFWPKHLWTQVNTSSLVSIFRKWWGLVWFNLWSTITMVEADDTAELSVDEFMRILEGSYQETSLKKNSARDLTQMRILHVLNKTQDQRWDSLLRAATQDHGAVLYAHVSDGWSCITSEQVSIKSEACFNSFRRERKRRTEWLMVKQFLKTMNAAGVSRIAVRNTLPQRMSGKSGWHICSASLRSEPIRMQCATSIVCTLYLQDGLRFNNFTEKQMARHLIMHRDNALGLDEASNEVAGEEDWVFSLWCVLHVASLSIKWGMTFLVMKADLVDDLHISIKSLRNGSDTLFSVVQEFAITRVRYRRSTADERNMHWTFWVLGGVSPAYMDILMKSDPWWDLELEVLWVDLDMEHEDSRIAQLVSVICYFFRWVDFSDTRWAGTGPAFRKWMMSVNVGVEFMVAEAIARKDLNHEFLGGYARTSSL